MRIGRRTRVRVPEGAGRGIPTWVRDGGWWGRWSLGGVVVVVGSVNRCWLSLPCGRSETAMIGAVIRSVLVVDYDPEFRRLAGRLLAAS
jgi:hypothetical protein